MPLAHMYDDVDEVSRDIELRGGPGFFPEGTHPEVDMSSNEQHDVAGIFSENVDVFGHCILIRDYAEPLRVGSGLVRQRTALHRQPRRQQKQQPEEARSLRAVASPNTTRMELDAPRALAQRQSDRDNEKDEEIEENVEDDHVDEEQP